MKRLFSIALIFFLYAGFFTGCKKDKGVAPTLPPVESMTIDFSNFTSMKKSIELTADQKGTNNSNWEYAATVAGTWNLIITTTLAIPLASFKLAMDQEPVYISTKNWQWSYTVTVSNVTYSARLTGQIGASNVTWTMYVSNPNSGTNGFAEFVWFTGTSQLDGTAGQWILNQSAQVQQPYLQIDWTTTSNSISSVKYTYVKSGDAFQNSYIIYGLTTDALNAYYTVHYYDADLLKFSDVNIEWNSTTSPTGNGKVQSTDYMGDSNWYCWDSNKINITCP